MCLNTLAVGVTGLWLGRDYLLSMSVCTVFQSELLLRRYTWLCLSTGCYG